MWTQPPQQRVPFPTQVKEEPAAAPFLTQVKEELPEPAAPSVPLPAYAAPPVPLMHVKKEELLEHAAAPVLSRW